MVSNMAVQSKESIFTTLYGAQQARMVVQNSVDIDLPMPWLAGPHSEQMGSPGAILTQEGPLAIARTPSLMFGAAIVEGSDRLEGAAESTYRTLLDLCSGWHLHRIWNYVPQINQHQAGLERYQQFNIGRWVAFEEHFGRDLRSHMPAASAVGVSGGHLLILFVAGKDKPLYFENPAQVPAYHYPAEYGPRPPGFARGVVVEGAHERTVYLSGTASIEGHRSVGEGDWAMQFRTTMMNIQTMLERMGAADALKPEAWKTGRIREGTMKCYLRHSESLSFIQDSLYEQTGLSQDQVSFVQADICRPELDLEIEATFKMAACSCQTKPGA